MNKWPQLATFTTAILNCLFRKSTGVTNNNKSQFYSTVPSKQVPVGTTPGPELDIKWKSIINSIIYTCVFPTECLL